jgi:hypothetical protein
MAAASISKTLVNFYKTTGRHIPEGDHPRCLYLVRILHRKLDLKENLMNV